MSADTRKKYFMHIKGIVVVTLIGTAISLLMSSSDYFTWRHVAINLLYCFMIGTSLWFGNFSINPIIERLFGKKNLSPGWKLISSLTGMLLMSSSIILFVNWFWVAVIWGEAFSKYLAGSGSFIMIIEIVVVIIIALVLYINEFFSSWREAVKNEESLKREKLALEYDSLKNQVNPHFLFNSLNTLSGLIVKDGEKATRFVKQLSDIYRYVLEQKDRELVPLDTEMKFVSNYISLMKIRFGDNLTVETNIREESLFKIIPLSVQMLVENAIKHNIISRDKPLTIKITMAANDYLQVSNNLQKKSSILGGDMGEWEKHGLMNIKSRYEYLSERNFEVNGAIEEPFPEELDGSFVVSVPLIR